MKKGPQIFERFTLRTPLLPSTTLTELMNSKDFYFDLQKILNRNVVSEAIYIASKEFYTVLKPVLITGFDHENKAHRKLARSALAYVSRMCSRSTPYGLFAGVSIGNFSSETKIMIKSPVNHQRMSLLDLEFLSNLVHEEMIKNPLPNQTKFYTNTSLYHTNTEFRYVEPVYMSEGISYELRGLKPTKHLEKCIEIFRKGTTLEKARETLLDLGYDSKSSNFFLGLLIQNKVILSEMIPSVLGAKGVSQIIKTLKKQGNNNELSKKLEYIVNHIEELDKTIGNSITLYHKLEDELKSITASKNIRSPFNVTMYNSFSEIKLGYDIKRKILRAYDVLSALSIKYENRSMLKFMEHFKKAYDQKRMRLVDVLDVDIGIGYPIGKINPSIDKDFFEKFGVPSKSESKEARLELAQLDIYFSRILNNGNKSNILEITDKDLKNIQSTTHFESSLTFNCRAKLIELENKIFLETNFMGGGSATSLLGRFALGNKKISTFVKDICDYEQSQQAEKMLSEIGHYPGGRVGNILFRKNPRQYAISYLDGGNLPEKLIPVKDILISVERDRVKLWNSKTKKEIIPFLGNAHNYFKSKLPIYKFLCDVQYSGTQASISFSWGPLLELYSFLPRLVYKDVILKRAMWKLDIKVLEKILKTSKEEEKIEQFNSWKKDCNLPSLVLWAENDNLLEVDTENSHSLLMLLDRIKEESSIWLQESFVIKNGIVKNSKGKSFTNEFIFHLKR